MEVILAESAGFCFGVKRAVDTVYEQIKTGKKIYTYGPIIHNEEVVKDLKKKVFVYWKVIKTLRHCRRELSSSAPMGLLLRLSKRRRPVVLRWLMPPVPT